MKLFFLIFIGIVFISCKKQTTCNYSNPSCEQSPPEGVTCMAYFESWIYDKSSKSCKWTGYSGCNQVGFDSKEECEKCDCLND
jgi:hypothetical protein